jgi:hypothetical protein
MDIYGEREKLFDNVYITKATRQPCPVCGHPTGDCGGEAKPPEKIVGIGIMESLDQKATILIEENIYEERQITPFFKTKVVIHRKGSYVTIEQAKKLGLL